MQQRQQRILAGNIFRLIDPIQICTRHKLAFNINK
jgi:hypothetical protein